MIGGIGIIAVVFVVLKLTGVVDWSWWWVLSPLWIGLVIWAIMSAVGLATAGIFSIAGRRSGKRTALCIIGVILLFIATLQNSIGLEYYEWTIHDTAFSILYPLGYYIVIQGSYYWAREKGRSGWWCLMGLLAPIGYIVLMKLRDNGSLIKGIGEGTAGQIETGFTEIPTTDDNRLQKTKRHTTHFCSVCGHKCSESSNYCPSCGNSLIDMNT